MTLTSILIVCSAILQGVFSADWAYTGTHGAAHWAESFPTCGGKQQSPINILEGNVRYDRSLEQIKFTNYDTSVGLTMTLGNNGHTVAVSLSGSTQVKISQGGLPDGVFRALQFHFHWGDTDSLGSEHLVNGLAYPMELHIVHFNTKYANPIQKQDGLAVLGFFFEVSEEDNPAYFSIVESLSAVLYTGLKANIAPVSLNSLLPRSFDRFYRYSGSLTTPPCQESVTWTVFKDTIKISQAQLEAFRLLMDPHADPISNNFRPTQPLNDRYVTSNFDPDIHWSYTGGKINVEEWPRYYSDCQGNNQSPVAIRSRGSRFDPELKTLDFDNYDVVPNGHYTLTNNGHTASLDISAADASIFGGDLPEEYQAARLHFHWGSIDQKGSEHTLDNRAFPMEVHIVHYKKSLEKLTKAVFQPQGLAVLGVFFEISLRDNPALDILVKGLRAVRVPGSDVASPPFRLSSLLPTNNSSFYRYSGSLTIPGCYETVIWTVFKDTVKISRSQLSAFRLLRSSDRDENGNIISLVNNYRPVQDLHGREVTRSFIDLQRVQRGRPTRPEALDLMHSVIASRIKQDEEEEENSEQ